MPEIGEVARVVHFLRKHAVGRTIAAVKVQEDDIIYGKVGTSATEFQRAMTGKKITDARQQGKYFWLAMNEPPHPLMHLGMTGWVHFSNESTGYYKPKKPEEDQWPPRFWKFVLELEGKPECKVAFVDARRLGRIRLIQAAADEMRNTTPLKENGPDPVVDKDILTVEWLANKMRSKKVPIKALLLDQANISGVGNWVGDEVLFQARIHPEQYSNTFSDEQIKRLHDKLIEVCTIACETLSDSAQFPQNWLMRHRWKKGKKESSTLPTGEKIIHLTVGGRTSAVVPSLQKKTGAVAGDVSSAQLKADSEPEEESAAEEKPSKAKSRKSKATTNGASKRARASETNGTAGEQSSPKRAKRASTKTEDTLESNRKKLHQKPGWAQMSGLEPEEATPKARVAAEAGRRRSSRLSGS